MSKEIAEEYASSLADLTVNSKPLINMLTILAEENVDHAGVIVDTVEKHLEKVHADIKLPVLYLVDSIIKNVGGAYVQKFSQIIVNMFTRTFKQVDEKVRSQMFKLRETWHDVFPATKLYQLDVKVNLIDPAWPIQAQPQQSTIHPAAAPATSTPSAEEDEKMKLILAKKEQELLMLQRKKIEMELEKTRRALEIAAATNTKMPAMPVVPPMPVALVNPVLAPAPDAPPVSIKQRLGPPVSKAATGARIAPVSAALAAARRDPRLARRPHAATPVTTPVTAPVTTPTPAPIAPNVFDIKPLERVTKRKNVITIDVRPDAARRDPRLDKRKDKPRLEARREDDAKRRAAREARRQRDDPKPEDPTPKPEERQELDFAKLQIADAKQISKLPPIPKIKRDGKDKRERTAARLEKKKRANSTSSKEGSAGSSPEKKVKQKKEKKEPPEEPEPVAFKELKNHHPERYRGRARSPSPEPEARAEAPNLEVVESKDVDLRVLPAVAEVKAAPVAQKRSSTEMLEVKAKKNKMDKFDRLFGNEDVDLRQLPQVEEKPASPKADSGVFTQETASPVASPKKDWHEVKEKEETKKTPSKLDLVRAKLAEATKGKDRLGRPFLFSKSPSIERERRRTISAEDVDLRVENSEEFDAQDHKKTISIIMDQAKEQFSDGKLDKNQYNTLMYQVLQLNEKLKLKEAKQRESLEISKRKLHAVENNKLVTPKSSPKNNNFGDIDERVMPVPGPFVEPEGPSEGMTFMQDSDMRMMEGPSKGLLPRPPMMPMFAGPQPAWRGPFQPRVDNFARRPKGVVPPFFRGKFDKRAPRPPFPTEPPLPFPAPLPTPQMGMCQGEFPLEPYVRSKTPPPLGAPGVLIPTTRIEALEYIDRDPVKTIQIDGIPREIRFYGETAIIMLDWDDPREIKFLPGSRRVTFDNKDSIVLNFNEEYKQVEIDDQVFDIRFGAPTRELFINGRWHECFFGGAPLGVIIDGKPRLIHLEGPLPQVDIGKIKRTDLVAGRVNLIVDATQMCPVFLDAKLQKFAINGQFFTIRFVDAFRTVLINEQPFQVEFGGLPRPIYIGNEKHFIRFSVLPRHVRPGHNPPPGMQGEVFAPREPLPPPRVEKMEQDPEPPRPNKTPSPENEMSNQGGLDMLASLMPSSMAPASGSDYSSADPMFVRPNNIPGLETPTPTTEQKPAFPTLGNIDDLFAKLVATGIIKPQDSQEKEQRVEEKPRPKEDRNVVHRVDLTRPETLRVKQPALVAKLYGGMQCSGCGARFPPEHTVRYSQHLDWHFRQNRRERDSARRAHSRHWHYDLADWVQYEELEDLEEREKSWFETDGAEAGEGGAAAAGTGTPPAPDAAAPSVAAGAPARAACALCGDAFLQFYNEDQEEWHLRNSVRHDDRNYHPLCLDDYKVRVTSSGRTPPAPDAAAPSVAAGAPARAACALCGDAFLQFYNEDQEEWHLRNSVRHDDRNYHPLCLDDYKVRVTSSGRTPPAPDAAAPSVAAGAPARAACALCGDAFLQFYNEDQEEWHLRNSVRHDDRNYHPLCLDDYKVRVTSSGRTPPAPDAAAPSVAAGAPARAACALCGDAFLQFYNEDQEEWHLRNSVRHDDRNYHPLCLDDYKVRVTSSGRTPPAPDAAAPSVAAGAPARAACALCGDAFLQFYNEDQEEWHLRNSVRHDDRNYHPLCLDDYKASLTKEEPPKEETPEEEKVEEEAIEIKDVDDTLDQSDNESVVEVIDNDKPVEIDDLDDEPPADAPKEEEPEDGDEDDVVFKAEPVPEVVVEDNDTDDETSDARRQRDQQASIDFGSVRVKQEPVDPDDEPIITAEEAAVRAAPDSSRAALLAAIDGNAEPAAAAAPPPAPIRINITKAAPLPGPLPPPGPALDDVSDGEPPPPGAEPEPEPEPEPTFALKPALRGADLVRQPRRQRGTELSGLCSVM